MKKIFLTLLAVAALSAGATAKNNKATVQSNFSSKADAIIAVEEILENEGFEIQSSSSSKVVAVLSMKGPKGPGERPEGQDGQRPEGQRPPQGNGQRPPQGMGQGGPGMGGPGMGQGGPQGMGPGGPGMQSSNSSDLPTVTVKVKKSGAVIVLTEKNGPEIENGNGMQGGMLGRIASRIPNSGVSYK